MSRVQRVWYPGAIYHITSRGIRQTAIFRDKQDRRVYLSIIRRALFMFDFSLFAYCLMTNHTHLHLQTGQTEIWKIMRRINLHYAKYFNNRYNLVGHLFQDRYDSRVIERTNYNLTISRYIHMNPVEANIVKFPLDYRWSSYDIYLGKRESKIVEEKDILAYFNGNRRRYQKFVEK